MGAAKGSAEDVESALPAQAAVSPFGARSGAFEGKLSVEKAIGISHGGRVSMSCVAYPSKSLAAFIATELFPAVSFTHCSLFLFVFFGKSRFVPSAMRGQIGRAVEDFVAFRASVLHVNNTRASGKNWNSQLT